MQNEQLNQQHIDAERSKVQREQGQDKQAPSQPVELSTDDLAKIVGGVDGPSLPKGKW